VLAPDARELQRQLIEGWAEAAREIAPAQTSTIENWLGRRLAHIEANRSHVVVYHDDLAAWLPHDPGRAGANGRAGGDRACV
jgi:hypothetical protein